MQVERRAFNLANMAVGNPDDALDILQDAMMKLVNKYAHKPPSEWKPLFYRILNNHIMDWHRQRGSRGRWMVTLNPFRKGDEGEDYDPITTQADDKAIDPGRQLEAEVAGEAVVAAVKALPLRQQQAFMLRAWEGMSVIETSKSMGCSEGSVKTHYSRGLASLRKSLEAHYE